mmetsp:Transcript_43268/g.106281  ORF Transcript_43268/g.106281 Transcript_43268/m.106281 type:complete len:216 (+) Transcript_43268:576-1223(+)
MKCARTPPRSSNVGASSVSPVPSIVTRPSSAIIDVPPRPLSCNAPSTKRWPAARSTIRACMSGGADPVNGGITVSAIDVRTCRSASIVTFGLLCSATCTSRWSTVTLTHRAGSLSKLPPSANSNDTGAYMAKFTRARPQALGTSPSATNRTLLLSSTAKRIEHDGEPMRTVLVAGVAKESGTANAPYGSESGAKLRNTSELPWVTVTCFAHSAAE